MVASVSVFGQKKEVGNAFKAVESNDISTAISQLSAADNILGGKTYLLEPAVLEQYYFTKGVLLLKQGKTGEAANFLSKIADLGKSKIYTGKDSSKNKVYYVGKEAADASGISGLKEETYVITTLPKLAGIVNPLIQSTNTAAMAAYDAKNFELAGDKFSETYYLLKAAGQENTQLMYNAAISYAYAKKNVKAIEAFTSLINKGYTGVATTYTALNKKTGSKEEFDKATWELMKKNADYSEFKTETSESVESALYEGVSSLLITENRTDEALNFIEKGLKKFPNDTRLAELKADAYLKAGNSDAFVKSLKEQLAVNGNDAVNWYNLGLFQSKNPSTVADAEDSYKKAIAVNPEMASAYQNLTLLIMGDDEVETKKIETARKSGNSTLATKLLEERRARFAKALPYAEKWYGLEPQNITAVQILKGFYLSAKNDAKYKEMKAKEAELLK